MDKLRLDDFHVLLEQVVDGHVRDEYEGEDIEEEEQIIENDSTSEYGYSGSTQDGVNSTIREIIAKYKKERRVSY